MKTQGLPLSVGFPGVQCGAGGDIPSRVKDEPLPLARPQPERGRETCGRSGFGGDSFLFWVCYSSPFTQ